MITESMQVVEPHKPCVLCGTEGNSIDPDVMLQNAAPHLGIHVFCLLSGTSLKSETKI